MQEIIISINDLAKYIGFDDDIVRTWCYNYQISKWLVTSKRPFGICLCDESINALRKYLAKRDTKPSRYMNRLEKFNKGIERIKNEYKRQNQQNY